MRWIYVPLRGDYNLRYYVWNDGLVEFCFGKRDKLITYAEFFDCGKYLKAALLDAQVVAALNLPLAKSRSYINKHINNYKKGSR